MVAYVIAQIDVHDPDGYQDYLAGFMDIFNKYDGRLLVTSNAQTTVVEGHWAHGSTVVMEFPSRDKAEAWLADPDYQVLADIRKRTARANLVVVEGVD